MSEITLRQSTRSIATFQRELEEGLGQKIQVRFNNNISTMLSVRWKADATHVSLHEMFLDAPRNVMSDLACYLSKRNNQLTPSIKAFIETAWNQLDYTNQVDPMKLVVQGRAFNLEALYSQVNKTYFNNELDYSITWYGDHQRKNRSRVTFGLYYPPFKLIKINRILDHMNIPNDVVAFVIYHEMLHGVFPSYFDEKGYHRVHTKEFKKHECQFYRYEEVKKWFNLHKPELFVR